MGFFIMSRNIPIRVVRAIRSAYNAPNRFYHNQNHLDHLFSVQNKLFDNYESDDTMHVEDGVAINAGDASDILYLAVLFHDVEYNIWNGSPINEADSAHHLVYVYGDVLLNEGNWNEEELLIAAKMIQTTALHDQDNSDKSFMEKLLLDIDISNFGESLDVCKYNQEQIYLEFKPRFPDKDKFLAGNVAFLQKLLDRPSIYYTAEFASREAQARANIEAMIKGG